MEKNKYRSLFENMELGVVYQDSSGKIIEANPAASLILGISQEELKKLTSEDDIWQAIREDGSHFPGKAHPSMRALSTGRVVKNVKMGIYNHRIKKRIWLLITAVPEFREGEKKPYRVFTTFNDITNQYIAEKKLAESETKFRSLFENGPIGVAYHRMIYDKQGNPIDYYFLDANEHFIKLTGVDPRGKLVTEAFPGIENDPADWINTYARAAKYGETVRLQQHLESNDRWYDIVGYQSSLDHFVAAFLEITDQKKKEFELEYLKNKAIESDKLKTTFLANMSHEIRTPMNGILGFAELLQDPKLDGKDMHRYIEIILKSGKRMLNIINDLIDISKIEAGQIEIKEEIVCISDVLDEIDAFFSPEAELKSLIFKINKDKSIDKITGYTDRNKLVQIISNLVKNALKFTFKGEIELGCKVINKLSDFNLILEFFVRDTGIGIPEEMLNDIFERFHQGDNTPTRKHEGSGLGLAITKAFVEAIGGQIKVDSKVTEGSCFTFTLPLRIESTTDIKSWGKISEIDFKKSRHCILVAEDEDINFIYLNEILESKGISVKRALTGIEAVEMALSDDDIELVLMDIKMPAKNGYDATIEIKKQKPYLPIVVQTAYAQQNDRLKAFDAGCDGFITKPTTQNELLDAILPYLSKPKNIIVN